MDSGEAPGYFEPLRSRETIARPPPAAHRVLASFNSRRAAWLFCLIVLAPAAVYTSYLAFVATPRYTSEFRVLVRSAGQTKELGLPQLAGLSLPTQSSENSYAVIQYLKSQPAALELDSEAGIRRLYSSPRIDGLSKLNARASSYALTHYWNGKLDAYFENTTNTVVVRVTTFDSSSAHNLALSTLRLSERFVNNLSERSRSDLLNYAQRDVETSEAQLREINAQLYALRNQRGLIDPRQTAVSTLERQAQVQEAITAVEADIASRRPYLANSSPVMQALNKRLGALEAGLAQINAEAVVRGRGQTDTLAGSINAFEKLQADEDFAQKKYQVSLTNLESARQDYARQQIYLDTIVPPTVPDRASYPNLFKEIGIFLIFVCAIWGIVTAFVANVSDRL
jgi:capsular polysaccharide transport system permease protein